MIKPEFAYLWNTETEVSCCKGYRISFDPFEPQRMILLERPLIFVLLNERQLRVHIPLTSSLQMLSA
jgi:hypothetical protein